MLAVNHSFWEVRGFQIWVPSFLSDGEYPKGMAEDMAFKLSHTAHYMPTAVREATGRSHTAGRTPSAQAYQAAGSHNRSRIGCLLSETLT